MLKDKLVELRTKKGLSQSQMAKLLNITRQAYNHYETGIRIPTAEGLNLIADIFDVSTDHLLGREDVISCKKGIKIPVLGKVQAGYPAEAIENIIDYEEITQEMAAQGEYFALQIRGDSMEPKFSEGDVVIVRKQSMVNNGDIAIVMVNGDEATVKKFYKKENGVTLMPTNTAKYEPMLFSKQEVDELPVVILGKVVELRAKF